MANHDNLANLISERQRSRPVEQVHELLREHKGESSDLVFIYKGRQQFTCLCKLKLPMTWLNRHLEDCWTIPTGVRKPTKFRCSKCSKLFGTLFEVEIHHRVCGTPRRIPRNDLSSGQISHDQATPEPIQCRHCDRRFSSSIGRGQHERIAHRAQRDDAAPSAKRARWDEAEDGMIVEAEAMVRIANDLGEERVVHGFSLDKAIANHIMLRNPKFSRTTDAIAGRRTHGRQEAHHAAVIEKMRAIRARADGQVTRPLHNVTSSTANKDMALRSKRSPEASIDCTDSSDMIGYGCDCGMSLSAAIDTHIEKLASDTKATERCTFLRSVKTDLNAYESAGLMACYDMAKQSRKQHTKKVGKDWKKINVEARTRRRTIPSKGNNRAARRSRACAHVRDLYDNEGPKKCLQHLRNPADSGICPKATVDLFKAVFESEVGMEDNAPYIPREARNPHVIHSVVTAAELRNELQRISKDTAPGPDGITMPELLNIEKDDLACLYNIFLLRSDVPRALKVNRTTMIPKSSEPSASDWRPITVASLIDRLFAKVLESRLSRVIMLHPNQRGFTRSVDGCGENITAYEGALRYARTHVQPLVITSLDLAKAFDSIQYSSIGRALHRLSVDTVSIGLFMNLCHGQVTKIKHEAGEEDVELRKGVRQGWPLSPILFLSVVDELITDLSEADGFHIKSASNEECSMTGYAFADDLILYSDGPTGMQNHVGRAERWCSARGMRINPKKSTVLYLERARKLKRLKESTAINILIDGIEVPVVTGSYQRILGVHIKHTGEVDHKISDFESDLELVKSSALRATQKVAMIRQCLLPMIQFRLVYGYASKKDCKKVDSLVKKALRCILHLPAHLARSVFYNTRKNGGLYIPMIEETAPLQQGLLASRMKGSSHLVTRILATRECHEKLLAQYAEPCEIATIDKCSIAKIRYHLAEQRMQRFVGTTHGEGWSMFIDAPRLFLDAPRERHWTDKDVIVAIKMRAGLLWTRALAARYYGQTATTCRGCGLENETQAHILSKCTATQADRTARHNSVMEYIVATLNKRSKQRGSLVRNVKKDYTIYFERENEENELVSNKLCPDIAVTTDRSIVLIEISVVYERNDLEQESSMVNRREHKLAKYRILREVLQQRFNKDVAIHTVIVGCRGGWIESNDTCLAGTGIPFTDFDKNCIVERAVRGSIITYQRFVAKHYDQQTDTILPSRISAH